MVVLQRAVRFAGSPGHGRVHWANALRGVAAGAVVIFHLGALFWTDQETGAWLARAQPLYGGDSDAPTFARVLDALPLNLGAFGVSLFFVISGCVIAYSLERYSRRGFLIGRCLRILPTYAAGYLITCAVIASQGDPRDELGFGAVLAGSVPGLQHVLGRSAPADGIVWTLTIEIVFYVVCLIGYRRLTGSIGALFAVAVACVAVQQVISPDASASATVSGFQYLVLIAAPFLPVMLVGVTLSGVRRQTFSRRSAAAAVLALSATHYWLLRTSAVVETSEEYRVSFVLTIGLAVLISATSGRWTQSAPLNWVSGISYPLYVVHPVLGYAVLSQFASRDLPASLGVCCALSFVTAVAWVLHVAVERPSHRLGRRLGRALSRPTPLGGPQLA